MVAAMLHRKYREGLYYFKSPKTGVDVDFYIPETGTVIQAAYSIQGEAGSREVGNLIKTAKEVSASKRFLIVTYEEEEVINEDGVLIEVIPLYKFLLDFRRKSDN